MNKLVILNPKLKKPKVTWHRYHTENTTSYLDWYYCDRNSNEFPIRDFTKRRKLEPHYENQTFNLYRKCNARLLRGSIKRKDSHVFFFTKYVGKNKKSYGIDFITGYYKIERYGMVGNPLRYAIKSKNAVFVNIFDAYPMKDLFGIQHDNPRWYQKLLDGKTTSKLLNYFKNKENRIDEYIIHSKLLSK